MDDLWLNVSGKVFWSDITFLLIWNFCGLLVNGAAILTNQCIDLQNIVRWKIHKLQNWKLITVAKYFMIPAKYACRALEGCRLVYTIYCKLNEMRLWRKEEWLKIGVFLIFSPRERGWSLEKQIAELEVDLFPARAGVIRTKHTWQQRKKAFPRASGGDPTEQDTKEVFEDFFPRKRG